MNSFYQKIALNIRYAFRPLKPLLTARLANAVFKSYILKQPPLRYVDFALDFACNLRCAHCFATSLRNDARLKMTVEDYGRVAKQCMELGAVNFSFQGGEPLLLQELPTVVTACRPHANLISVTTNGTLLSADRAKELRRLGVDILTVSLDSSIADEHDRFRGVFGAFARTTAGIDAALAAGLRVTIGSVVTHQNLRGPGVAGLIDMAKRLKTIISLILPAPAGNWSENTSILLTAEDLVYIDELVASSPYVRTDFQANFGPEGCGAAKEILYLTPYGDVLPCPFMHISFGNALKEPLAVIRARMLANPWLASYQDTCLVSTNPEFLERYMKQTVGRSDLPLPADEVFGKEAR